MKLSMSSEVLRYPEMEPAAPALIGAAKRKVESINAAELRVRRAVRSAQETLLAHPDLEVVDWTMPFEVTFTVLLQASAGRRFY